MLSNFIDRIRLPFRKEKEFYFALYNILGFYPHNITYYKIALMHKSLGHRATAEELKVLEGYTMRNGKGGDKTSDGRYEVFSRKKGRKGRMAEEKGKGYKKSKLGKQLNNERLEFLGDAILDAVVGDVVYRCFPGKTEGFLTNTRSKLVQRETLGRLAKEMGVTKLILASGRNATHNSYIGGNAFEALVGAAYLDRGYQACYDFWVNKVMKNYLNVDKVAYKEVNFKSKILEWSQKNRIKMEFVLEEQTQDKQGSPKFVYSLCLEGIKGGTAEGFSKKESQQKACEITLKKLRSDSKFLDSVFAAKTARTKMEENPTTAVPAVEEQKKDDFFVDNNNADTDSSNVADNDNATVNADNKEAETPAAITPAEEEVNNLSLDDIQATPKQLTQEEIIAKAEEEAYNS